MGFFFSKEDINTLGSLSLFAPPPQPISNLLILTPLVWPPYLSFRKQVFFREKSVVKILCIEEKEEKIYFLHTFCNNFRVSFCLLKCVGWNFFWKRDMWKRKYMQLTQLTILCKLKLKPLILIVAWYENCCLGLFFNF